MFKSTVSQFYVSVPNLQPLPTSPAIHEQTRTMMLCFWLFVFGVHFAQTSSRSTASHQSGFQSAYQNAVYRSTAHRNALRSDALNGVDRSVRPESRWKRRPDTPVSASSSGQSDQLLAESSEDDPAVEPTPDSSDHAYSAFSYHKKVRFSSAVWSLESRIQSLDTRSRILCPLCGGFDLKFISSFIALRF